MCALTVSGKRIRPPRVFTGLVFGCLFLIPGLDLVGRGVFPDPPAPFWSLFAAGITFLLLSGYIALRLRQRHFLAAATCLLLGLPSAAVALLGSRGPLCMLAFDSVPRFVVLHIETLRGRSLAEKHFRSGVRQLLGYTMSELFLAGVNNDRRTCFVIYIDHPTGDQRERLTTPDGIYPDRLSCISAGTDAVACIDQQGDIRLFATKILVAGCILDSKGLAYNERMADLLMDNSLSDERCGISSADLPTSRSQVGSFSITY